MNDSRTRQVSVARVMVRAPTGRALTGGSPEPGAGGGPPAVVSEHGPAGACGGAAKVPVAATVANVPRGSLTFSRRWIVLVAPEARRAPVASSLTPVALVSGATASVKTVA